MHPKQPTMNRRLSQSYENMRWTGFALACFPSRYEKCGCRYDGVYSSKRKDDWFEYFTSSTSTWLCVQPENMANVQKVFTTLVS